MRARRSEGVKKALLSCVESEGVDEWLEFFVYEIEGSFPDTLTLLDMKCTFTLEVSKEVTINST